MTITEALRKMTLAPAQRLEARVPAMKKKGRMQVGADADVTIFDPATVRDRSTFEHGKVPSEGIRHVIVGGTFVVRDGSLTSATPGRAIRYLCEVVHTGVTVTTCRIDPCFCQTEVSKCPSSVNRPAHLGSRQSSGSQSPKNAQDSCCH
jgi:hypothetical protein